MNAKEKWNAALQYMKDDGCTTVYCTHVGEITGSPSCCDSCHTDEELGYDNLYDADYHDKGVPTHLCCAMKIFLES